MQARAPIPPEEVTAAAQRIAARYENAAQESMLERFVRWLAERLSFSGGVDVGSVTMIVLWSLVGALIVLGLVIFVRWSLRRRAVEVEERKAGPTLADRLLVLRREAAEARARGDLRRALRLQLFALVLGLGARGELEYRDAWTNRELLRRGRPKADTLAFLASLVDELEAKEFGRVPITEEDVARLEGLVERAVGPLVERAA
jgi:hypothetical protein